MLRLLSLSYFLMEHKPKRLSKDGRIIGCYFVTPKTDMELFSEMADEVFGLDADELSLDEDEDFE